MGKKNKNKKSIYDFLDMTAEEQKANAELFNDYEEGEASFLDALSYKVPSAPISQSSFTKQIESACFNMKNENSNNNEEVEESEETCNNKYMEVVSEVISKNQVEAHDSYTEECVESLDDEDDSEEYEEETHTFETDKMVCVMDDVKINIGKESIEIVKDNEATERSFNIPQIHCHYNQMTGRVIIDDEAIATAISLICTSTIQLNQEVIPTEHGEYSSLINSIFYFIILCKHPSVIVSEETFDIEFGMFKSINTSRLAFFRYNGFVYIYLLDENMRDNFFDIADIKNMSEIDFLRYVVGAAYAVNTMHNIFMHDDEDEVESVMEVRHNIKDLIAYIEANFEVEYAGHDTSSGDVVKRLGGLNVTKLSSVLCTLDDLITTDDDDEDEEDDDNDDTYDYEKMEYDGDELDVDEMDDDVKVTDYPDLEATNTGDIDQMLEEMEPTENIVSNTSKVTKVEETTVEKITTIDSSKNNNMILPIHRR